MRNARHRLKILKSPEKNSYYAVDVSKIRRSNHLRCIENPENHGITMDKLPTSTGQFTGFQPSTVSFGVFFLWWLKNPLRSTVHRGKDKIGGKDGSWQDGTG